jgi:citrate lyase subunit beta/citryl-CoA lyase
MTQPVTGLYVPGHRPDRFAKAVASGADLIVFDLEDAVPADGKDQARANVAAFLTATDAGGPVFQVRVNPAETPAGRLDLAMLKDLPAPVELRLPKTGSPDDAHQAWEASGGHAVTALLESPAAVLDALAIARAEGVTRLGLGESDLSSALGVRSEQLLDYARCHVAYSAQAAGLPPPMLSPYPDIRDLDGLRRDTERGRACGWSGRLAIHPGQLGTIAAVFQPSPDEVEWAEAVLAAPAGGGVTTLPNGEMADPAMRRRAEAILARHTAI